MKSLGIVTAARSTEGQKLAQICEQKRKKNTDIEIKITRTCPYAKTCVGSVHMKFANWNCKFAGTRAAEENPETRSILNTQC